MTVTAAQIAAVLRGQGELTVLAEVGFGYEGRADGFLSVVPGTAYTTIPAQIADNASNSVTGDFTVEWFGVLPTYTSNANGAQGLMEKWDGVVLPNNRCFQLVILNGGTPRLNWDPLGTGAGVGVNAVQSLPATVSLSTVIAAGGHLALRAEAVMNNGATCEARYAWSPDNGNNWIPLGATVAGATTSTGVFDGACPLTLNGINGGATFFQYQQGAAIQRVKLYAGVGAARVLRQDFNPMTVLPGATTLADPVLGTWSIGADHTLVRSGRPAQGKAYFSDRPYVTLPSDAPPNTIYRDAIDAAPDFERAIDLKALGGRGSTAFGTLTLNNGDGSLDYLLDLILDGYDVAFYFGDRSWARADFQLAMVASSIGVKESTEKQIVITLGSRSALLNATLVGDPIASGPNAGKAKPVLLGSVSNFDVTPYLLDGTNFVYQFNHRAVNAILAASPYPDYQIAEVWQVRDKGVVLFKNPATGNVSSVAATDTLTKVAHGLAVDDVLLFLSTSSFPAGITPNKQYWVLASGLTADNFKVSTTRGGTPVDLTVDFPSTGQVVPVRRFYIDAAAATVTLSSSPAGRATLDFFGHMPDVANGGSQYGPTIMAPMDGFRYVLDTFTKLTAADRDDAVFNALGAAISAKYPGIAWGVPVTDRANVMDVLDGIALLTNSWYSWNTQGKLIVGKLDLQNLDSIQPIDTITEGDIEGEPAVENLPIQFGNVIVNGGANATVQTDGLADTVTPANRSVWGQPYWVQAKSTMSGNTDYSSVWWNYHRTAIDSKPINLPNAMFNFGLAPDTATIQAICDERTALFKPFTRKFTCRVGLDKYALNPGDCVLVTYPRYGLSAGKKFRVASVKTRITDKAVDLVLVRQSIPDYLSSSHA